MDSATLRQEVSQSASEVGRTKQSLTFAVMEESNAEGDKKGVLGNKIEQLRGDLEGCVADHASAMADLRVAEGAERSAAAAKEMEEQRAQQATLEKEAETAKQSEEKDIDRKDDKKPALAKKDSKSGIDPYDRTGVDPQDIDAKQAALLKQVQEFAAKPEVKDSSEAVDKDKPATAAAAVSAAPAIAHTDVSSVAKDSGAADAPSVKAAAGTSGASA